MVDLTKKKTLAEYGTGALADGDTIVTYRSTNAVGEKVFLGNIVAGTAASIADGTSTDLKMYSDKALKDAVNTGAIPVGTAAEIETGTDTTAKLYAPDQLNSAINSLIETAVPDGTEAQIIAGTDTTERKYTPADINGAVKDIAIAQYAGRTAMKAATGLTAGDVVYLSEGGRSGPFEYLVGDYSAEVAADTLEGVYVKLDAVAATVGVLKRRLNGYVTPEMFGGDPSSDSNGANVQAMEDLASSSGYDVRFPNLIGIEYSIQKRAGSYWRKSRGGLIRGASILSNTFPLIIADTVNDWGIESVILENALHGVYTQASSAIENLNALIAIKDCEDFNVRNIRGRNYSQGIFRIGCKNYDISGNSLKSGNTQVAADMEGGTYSPVANYTGTGAIVGYGPLGTYPAANEHGIESNNRIRNFGLDVGIESPTNAFAETPTIVSGNVVVGGNAAYQVYQGSLSDPGTATTLQRNVILTGNTSHYTWETGIYIRLSFGCQVNGGIVKKSNMNGILSETGTPFGGIVMRVSATAFVPTSPVIPDVGNLITGVQVIDIGRDAVGGMHGIQVRIENSQISDVVVKQSEERGYTLNAGASAIYVADNVYGTEIKSPTISGWDIGINYEGGSWPEKNQRNYAAGGKISGTRVGVSVTKMICTIKNIELSDITATGVRLTRAPWSVVDSVTVRDTPVGIELQAGCYASDYNDRSTARVGTTLTIKNNTFFSVAEPHKATQTTTNDTTFSGRCAYWDGDSVDYVDVSRKTSSGLPTTSSKATHQTGEQWLTNAPTTGGYIGSICTSRGTYGTIAAAITGSISSGSTTLTVTSSAELAENVCITISGVSGVKRITNVSGTTITIDSASDATVSSAAITYSTPVFKSFGLIA